MKRISIASIGAATILAAVPFTDAIPGVPKIWNMGSAIAQNTQAQSQVQLRLDAEKQVVSQDQQGKQKVSWLALQGKAVVQPGDVVRYTISGENKSDRAVKNLNINQPIPKGMEYMVKSAIVNANNAKMTYSIDGGRSFAENPTIQVKLPNGKVETKAAPASAYTHIRLTVPSVAAKTIVKGSYQVKVR